MFCDVTSLSSPFLPVRPYEILGAPKRMFASKFPSLYKPHINIDHSTHNSIFIDNVRGRFRRLLDITNLNLVIDIYLFTLYWTFILYTPLFILTGICAALILVFEPVRRSQRSWSLRPPTTIPPHSKRPDRLHRRFFIYAILVFLLYGIFGLFLSVLASTVVGFLIAGVYSAGRLRVST